MPDDAAGEAAMREQLATRYGVVRLFVILLAQALPLAAAPAGRQILAAVGELPELARRRVRQRPLTADEIDEELVPPMWQRAVAVHVADRDPLRRRKRGTTA